MIGWENNQGAYFINKLQEQVNAVESETSDIATDVGTLSSLTTTDKTSIVNAINEVDGNADTATSDISTISENIGTISDLQTTATNLVGAVNEVLEKTEYFVSLVNGSSSKELTFANGTKAVIFLIGYGERGILYVNVTSSGNPIFSYNGNGNTATVTVPANNKLSIANSGANNISLYGFAFEGSIE